MGLRRNDPNFVQVSAYISKDVGLNFKAACTLKQVSQTEALEQALALWLSRSNP